MGKLARGPLTIAGVGLQAAALGFKTLSASIAQFAQAEADVAKLDLALAQAGQLTDAYREKLQALAHELSESTAKSGTEWLGVLQRLTQFGAKPENISEYADAVKNLAGIMGGNIEEAAFIFSQAMQGNIEMLARWGIHADISKTKAQQLDEVMKQIALRGGGQLEARAQTLGGQFEKLEHATGRLLAVLGGGGAGTLSGIATILTDAFEYWSRVLGGPIAQLDSLTNTGSKAAGALHDAALAAKEFSDAQKKIDDAIQNSITAMKSQYTAIGQMIDPNVSTCRDITSSINPPMNQPNP